MGNSLDLHSAINGLASNLTDSTLESIPPPEPVVIRFRRRDFGSGSLRSEISLEIARLGHQCPIHGIEERTLTSTMDDDFEQIKVHQSSYDTSFNARGRERAPLGERLVVGPHLYQNGRLRRGIGGESDFSTRSEILSQLNQSANNIKESESVRNTRQLAMNVSNTATIKKANKERIVESRKKVKGKQHPCHHNQHLVSNAATMKKANDEKIVESPKEMELKRRPRRRNQNHSHCASLAKVAQMEKPRLTTAKDDWKKIIGSDDIGGHGDFSSEAKRGADPNWSKISSTKESARWRVVQEIVDSTRTEIGKSVADKRGAGDAVEKKPVEIVKNRTKMDDRKLNGEKTRFTTRKVVEKSWAEDLAGITTKYLEALWSIVARSCPLA